jgi:NADPH:quinone reductase-like Zn-dependent oxidoreductase
MRACVIASTGGLDQIEIANVPDPVPGGLGPRQVRVAMRAAALNHLEFFVIRGLLPTKYRYPHILGSDGAGVVEATGEEVTAVRPGDRVMINPGLWDGTCEYCNAGEHALCVNFRVLGEHVPGTMAEYVVIPDQNLAKIPPLDPPLRWDEAAAFSLATLTAWRMVVTRADVRPEETVLVWGIGGGVSLAAMRIAKLCGAKTIATSASDAKLAEAKRLGADIVLNHGRQDIVQEVRALTGRRGVDVVIENVGVATWEKSLRVLAKGGRLVTCGATTGHDAVIDLRRLFAYQYTLMGVTLGSAAEYAAAVRALARGALRPVVDRVYPLAQARAAFERLEQAHQLGKIAISLTEDDRI